MKYEQLEFAFMAKTYIQVSKDRIDRFKFYCNNYDIECSYRKRGGKQYVTIIKEDAEEWNWYLGHIKQHFPAAVMTSGTEGTIQSKTFRINPDKGHWSRRGEAY